MKRLLLLLLCLACGCGPYYYRCRDCGSAFKSRIGNSPFTPTQCRYCGGWLCQCSKEESGWCDDCPAEYNGRMKLGKDW